VVISLQNGVRNSDLLKKALANNQVLSGVVPFVVKRHPNSTLQRLMDGSIIIEEYKHEVAFRLLAALNEAGVKAKSVDNIREVQWGKLLVNLNNPINALLGSSMRAQLDDKKSREIYAAVISEALAVLKTAKINVGNSIGIAPRWIPFVLRLPNFWFRHFGGGFNSIRPGARSSMWFDLEQGHTTEIDYLNGEIVKIADKFGLNAPLNTKLVQMIRSAESRGKGSPNISTEYLYSQLRQSVHQVT
jgi:2-dehydropantoate 2-reductase